jgi:hypothetical protein
VQVSVAQRPGAAQQQASGTLGNASRGVTNVSLRRNVLAAASQAALRDSPHAVGIVRREPPC